jgi:tRNA pseudouridine13 synthase
MKLKQRPEDFQVEELTGVVPGTQGQFALYRLEKRGWTTPDALQAIRRRWKLEQARLSYGGLKDRHARTVQYFTIFHGPQRKLTHSGIHVDYLGRVAAPYTSRAVRANRFAITIRSLSQAECAKAESNLEEVRQHGVPNYFDDQRFGSVGPAGGFVARLLIFGQYEDALRLALTGAYEHDRAAQRQEKSILREHWGEWAFCKERLRRSHARSLVDYLVSHPTDFRGAIQRLRPELPGLFLSAYQSHLWNRMLACWLTEHVPPEELVEVPLRLGKVPMHRRLNGHAYGALNTLRLPLPSPRQKIEPGDARAALVEHILHEEGLRLDQLKLRGLRRMFFSRGERAALAMPSGIQYGNGDDEMHPGRRKLVMHCELPPGSYATLIVKRITRSIPLSV